jgi:hypothetical protein
MDADKQFGSGEELAEQGLKDLAAIRVTPESLLVMIASPRLKRLGVQYPDIRLGLPLPYEHRLYDLLCLRFNNDAHSQYNALLRRIDSYAHALEREQSLDTRRAAK